VTTVVAPVDETGTARENVETTVTTTLSSPTTTLPDVPTSEYNDTMRTCYRCDGERTSSCTFPSWKYLCLSLDDVCFSYVFNDSEAKLNVTKGCKPRNQCEAQQNLNDPTCTSGVVNVNCTFCCDSDLCNLDYYPVSTTTIAPTTPAPVCDMYGYTECLWQFQSLVLEASTNPDLCFNHFCGSMPDVFRCLAHTMEGCTCPDSFLHMNETLEAVLANMTAQCPNSCDPPAGYNCSVMYYYRVMDSFVGGAIGTNCTLVEKIESDQEKCRAKTVGSCDASVRNRINNTYSVIRREWTNICFPNPPALQPLNQTETSTCSVRNTTSARRPSRPTVGASAPTGPCHRPGPCGGRAAGGRLEGQFHNVAGPRMELQKMRELTGCWLPNPNGSAADPPARQAGVMLQSEEQRLPARFHPYAAVVNKKHRLES
jgi:hypothetical protein